MGLWNMKFTNKIKTFACRACKEILLTKTNLAKGNVIAITTCDFCMVEAEDCMHALCSCPPVHRVWRNCFLGVDFTHNVQHSFGLFVWDLAEKVLKIDMELFFNMACGLWNKRNFFIHNGKILDPSLAIVGAVTLIDDFKRACTCKKSYKKEKALR